eukprot:TRINITY_DN18137_c0_g1_i1.p1 TRINITY_DN18137_c0_g1~~TRINITY_DN18137_c0_g1_i1.p1  ORF type:complete len:380 (-),score=136.68 TRINITY_DN18137_c0_g1_i1:13-1152(-)
MDSLRNLWSREVNAREEEVRLRLSGLWSSSESRSEIIYEDRVALLTWIHDLCLKERESSGDEKYRIPVLAVDILDRFLVVTGIAKSQLQLTGLVCVYLASKVLPGVRAMSLRNLVQATDQTVKVTEVKEWELLVLSKLNWSLESIIPQDYLDALPPGTINDSILINASLIIALSLQGSKDFFSKHSRASIAFGALCLSLKEDEESPQEPVIKSELLNSVGLSQDGVESVRKELEGIMWALLGASSPQRAKKKASESAHEDEELPTSSSTPKSLIPASPLKEVILRQRNARKRLQSDFEDDEDNKENHNDSAIGLNASGLTDLPSSGSNSASSSANSSPDSATNVKRSSSSSLRQSKSSAELDRVLKTTQIQPLKKWLEN